MDYFASIIYFILFLSIKTLPAFENLNSLETLSIQNNKLMHIPEDVMDPILDTLRSIDIMGKFSSSWQAKEGSARKVSKVHLKRITEVSWISVLQEQFCLVSLI